MTIKQYQKIAAIIAKKITNLGGDPLRVRNLKATSIFEVGARNPKNKERQLTMESGDENAVITFNRISNPNNPNPNFRTLKPGSMSLYNTETRVNIDPSDYRFDSAQFSDLVLAIENSQWEISR